MRFKDPKLRIALLASTLACATRGGLIDKFEYFSIASDPDDYPHPEIALSDLVQSDGHAKLNHFCVIGLRGGNATLAKVLWQENNTMTLWEPGGQNDSWALLHSRRVWDLKKDVVPTSEDIGSSTYLISQAEVNETRAACQNIGNSYVIIKKLHHGIRR